MGGCQPPSRPYRSLLLRSFEPCCEARREWQAAQCCSLRTRPYLAPIALLAGWAGSGVGVGVLTLERPT
jgi:hypothetical protein